MQVLDGRRTTPFHRIMSCDEVLHNVGDPGTLLTQLYRASVFHLFPSLAMEGGGGINESSTKRHPT